MAGNSNPGCGLVAAADVGLAAHARAAATHAGFGSGTIGFGGEGGELLFQMLLSAAGAGDGDAVADELLELGSTVFTNVLENRH